MRQPFPEVSPQLLELLNQEFPPLTAHQLLGLDETRRMLTIARREVVERIGQWAEANKTAATMKEDDET